MNNSVGIIGAGWLGKELALTLMARHFSVQTTTQSSERMTHLQEVNIPVEQLVFPNDKLCANVSNIPVFSQQTLVVCLPPQLKKGRTDYPLKIQQIVQAAETGNVEHLILLSTTAIYNGLSGNISETTPLSFEAEKVAVLAEAENCAMSFNGRASILRLAGLVGSSRHPGRFFKRGRSLKDPQVCINLIHQVDAVELIAGLVKSAECSGIYNAVCNTRMAKKQFYRLAADSLTEPEEAIKSPQVISETILEGKIVQSDKIRAALNYQFCFDDLLDWLNNKTTVEVK